MTHTYNISDITCSNCVQKVKGAIMKLDGVTNAEVQLAAPQATITMKKHITTNQMQQALASVGKYQITEAGNDMQMVADTDQHSTWFNTYKPILLIGAYITAISLAVEMSGTFEFESWMRNFMAAFFLSFSFFKMLDLKGFAESYSTYDVIAQRWQGWGYVYAFIELSLGFAFLLNINALLTNSVAFVVMTVSIIGVLKSVLNRRKIKCACLGAVFNLPMSTVTIVEDALMIVMSGTMVLISI